MRSSSLLILTMAAIFVLGGILAAEPASDVPVTEPLPKATPSPRKIKKSDPGSSQGSSTSRSPSSTQVVPGSPKVQPQYNPKEIGIDKTVTNAERTETVDKNETITRSRRRKL